MALMELIKKDQIINQPVGKKEKIIAGILGFVFLILFIGIFWAEREIRVRVAEVFLVKPFQEADIVVNVDRSFGTVPGIWRALAQGGEEAAGVRMFASTIDFVKRLGIDYIRLDHIYDDDYYGVVAGRKADGSLDLDWSSLDETVDDILAIGAKPFFSLSYLPEEVGPGKIGKPNNWADWTDLVKQTVAHYSRDIDGVYYEVWNEPPLEGFGGWKMYGEKDYRQLYEFAALGAKQVTGVKPYKIGGPAIPDMSEIWIRLLFDDVIAKNLPLDFISWHRYTFSPDVFMNDVYQANVLTGQDKYKQFENIEMLITEWGPNSEKDEVYSSNVAASHALAVIRKMLDKVDYVFAFEVKDGPNQGQEAWGLLTHELAEGGVKEKPRFYLYDWLGELEGERVEVLGEGTQITGFAVTNNRTVTLILANYQPSGAFEESFKITLAGMKDGRYRLFEQKLFGEPMEKEIQIQGGSFVLNANMNSYEVMRVRISKISN